MNRFHLLLIFFVIFLGWAWPAASGQIPVFVSILPQKYFVEKIGGELVDVSVMVMPGASPATYEPKARQLAALSGAMAYFAIGVPFEAVWLEKISAVNPVMLMVHTDAGIVKMPMDGSHRPDTEHHPHGGIPDPHVWLSPPLVKILAGNILQGLIEIDPANRMRYEKNCNGFVQEIDKVDADLSRLFSGKKGLGFMVFHPSWGYFAKAYGLKQIPVEIEGKQPKPAQLQRLIEYARRREITVVFVQPQFSRTSAETLAAAIGGQVFFADPLAPHWADNLSKQAALFKKALR